MSRRTYNRVSSSHDDDYDEEEGLENIELATQDSQTNNSNRNNNSNNRTQAPPPQRRRRAPYTRVSANEVEDDEAVSSSSSSPLPSSVIPSPSSVNKKNQNDNLLEITILDFAQQTFSMQVSPSWTVMQLKEEGVVVHKVPVQLQRLVHSGKLLQDEKTLAESGIKEQGTIVHLFPRPRVVIQQQRQENATTSATADGEDSEDGGARVPTIVLDANEAQQRSQILVLGSVEYMEAQNNVKLFSFMLLVISAIELLNLLALAMGVPQQNEQAAQQAANSMMYPSADDIPAYDDAGYDYFNNNNQHNNNSSGVPSPPHYSGSSAASDPNLYLYSSWGWPNTIDLFISAAGVYVALLGIQASNENTRSLARLYVMGTFVVGIGWMLFNYFVTIQIDEEIVAEQQQEQQQEGGGSGSGSGAPSSFGGYDDDGGGGLDNTNIYKSALSVMILPGLVWVLCCLRAAQFHHLLQEAETEALDRIRSQMEQSSSPSQSPTVMEQSQSSSQSSSSSSLSSTTPQATTTSNNSSNNTALAIIV